jgi:phthiodiolone/phenolphthiodiolone dimycocerosates ketoreductase
MSLRFGIVGTAASAAQSLAVIGQCEDAGFDAAVWGDHWMGLFPPAVADQNRGGSADRWYHALAFMAIAAERTRSIRLAIGVTDLLRRHPADVAQALLTIAEIHPDRELIVGVGLGEAENVTPFGIPYHQRVDRLREAIELLRSFVSTGRVDHYDGEYFHLRDAVLEPRTGSDRIRIWVAAHGPRMLALCGKAANGWYPLATSPRHYAQQLEAVRDAAEACGRLRESVEAGLAVNICVVDGPSDAEAAAVDPTLRGFALWSAPSLFRLAGLSEHPLGAGSDGFRDYLPAAVSAGEYLAAIDQVPPEVVQRVVLIGSVAEICERLRAYEQAGAQTAFLWDTNRMRGRRGREIEVASAYVGRARAIL